MKIKKTTLYFLGILVIIVIAGYFMVGSSNVSVVNDKVINDNIAGNGQIQKVLISEKNYNYYPSEIKVKANQPVEITLDDKVVGCLRAFTIRDLGVSKYARTPDEKIIFTPNKKGTFTFSCSMGMGYGKIIVE